MKFLLKTLLVSLLIASSVGQEAEIDSLVSTNVQMVGNVLEFGNKVFDVIKENDDRFSKLTSVMSSLDLSSKEATEHVSKIQAALKSAHDHYDLMIADMRGVCSSIVLNRRLYHKYKGSPKTKSDFEFELQKRFRYLRSFVDPILDETKDARKSIDEINNEVNGASGKLVHLQETLSQLVRQKHAEIQTRLDGKAKFGVFDVFLPTSLLFKIRDLLRDLEKLKLLGKFTNEAKAYVEWMGKIGQRLKDAAHERGLDISELEGVAQAKERLGRILNKPVEKNSRNLTLSLLERAIDRIGDLSDSFMKKTERDP